MKFNNKFTDHENKIQGQNILANKSKDTVLDVKDTNT